MQKIVEMRRNFNDGEQKKRTESHDMENRRVRGIISVEIERNNKKK